MKYLMPVAVALSIASGPLHAQDQLVPQMSTIEIENDTASSGQAILVPILALLLILIAVSDTGGGGGYYPM